MGEIFNKSGAEWKKQRRVSTDRWSSSLEGAVGPDSETALWKAVRRDPGLPRRAAGSIALLAERIERRKTRARLRADHAQEIRIYDLSSADSWWKGQWQDGSFDLSAASTDEAGPESTER